MEIPVKQKPKSKRVGFAVDDHVFDRLQSLTEQFGFDRSEWMRKLVEENLDAAEKKLSHQKGA